MNCKQYLSVIVSVVIFSLLISPVAALINVEWTVDKVYGAGSQAVMIGKISEVVPEKQLAVITMTELLKGGTKPFAKIRALLPEPKDFVKQVRPDQPIVFFLTAGVKDRALLHVGDTWLKMENIANSDVWKSQQIDDKLTKGFPGRTSALVKMLSEKNAGNLDVIMDVFPKVPFGPGQRKLGKLEIQKPSWLLAEDLNGDKKPDLIVGASAGTKVFLAAGDGYQDATAQWGALGAGSYHAAGDVNGDGKIDLLIDGSLWINDGQKFTAAKMAFGLPAKSPLAAALIDVNGDQKLDAVFLTASGQVQIYENNGGTEKPWSGKAGTPLWSDGDAPAFAAIGDFGDTGKPHALVVTANGVTRYAFDADGGTPADFTRLTGFELKKITKFTDGFKSPVAVSLSMNGAGRPDLYLFSDTNPLLLLNRGLGTFFMDDFTTHGTPKPLAFTPNPTSRMARANMHGKGVDDVLILAEDGTLYLMENVQ